MCLECGSAERDYGNFFCSQDCEEMYAMSYEEMEDYE